MITRTCAYEILSATSEGNRHFHIVRVDLMKVHIEAAKTSLGACEEGISFRNRGCKAYESESKDKTRGPFEVHIFLSRYSYTNRTKIMNAFQ